MSAQERRERLLHGLNASQNERVVVNFSHLAHAIGMDAAEALILNMAEIQSLVSSNYRKGPDLIREALVEIDRATAIDVILRTQSKANKAKIDELLASKKNG